MAKRSKIRVRNWKEEDIPALVACHKAAYPDYPENGGHYGERNFAMQLAAFPEGQFLAEIDGQIVGYATSIIVQLDDDNQLYTYNEITGSGSFSTHEPSGDTLYGSDIAVHPDYRQRGVSKALYEQRRKLLKRYNLRRMLAYGRIPGYSNYAGRLTAREYVDKVVAGELSDPAINTHLKAGYRIKGVLLDLFWDDSSLNYATVLEMSNPDYKPEKRKIAAAALARPVRRVRVCAAQYELRTISSWDEFRQSVEFFVDTADNYHCHFLVLPELFTVQLFSTMPRTLSPAEAVRRLAAMTDQYRELFCGLAQKYRIYIVGGSHPVERDGELYNVAHLFTPSGQIYTQDKLHVTPWERDKWNIRPGQAIHIFETPLARLSILICYDIEFPEVARLLTLSGVETIFVPFSTDDKKAFNRVRITAHARAVENYIYTVISGNVGNMHTVKSYLNNYGQAAIFTPSDFAFAPHGILAEADPNVETVAISELDLTSLAQQRELGSVRPLYDRRPDLYTLQSKMPIRVIRTE
ncbi:MAG: bifunctional GNAT family N-acetyltransferase/carbon-nitrogen hydrolase family protein [Caldilineaceae bacterium]|nr:bifunctional GNAT family N-acetyltransferase/carbon-nitrogen hydrolase family protein [Caldilineaceae bacterium]